MSSKPLSVEYAKSGKSSCQGCRNNIGKGELRVGFVGKANFGAVAWYHYKCVWNDYKNLSTVDGKKPIESLLDGYGDLKEDDKKNIAKDLPKYCDEAVKKAKEKESGPKPQLAAEYAKSAKSSCKECSKSIEKEVLRLGFPGKANFGATAWYHYDCIWADVENLKSVDPSRPFDSNIDGYSELKEDDKKKLKRDLPKYHKDAKEKSSAKEAGPKPQLVAEYAQSAKSVCKGCSKNIGKGAFRLGFPGKANFGAPAWYHYDCIWSETESLKPVSSISLVDGFSKLKEEDQKKLEQDLPKSNKRKSDGKEGQPSPPKKVK